MVEATKSIVNAFIHEIQQVFPYEINIYYNIPTDINLLTLSFIQNYFKNDGVHRWKINDPEQVNKMLNCHCGQRFISDTFEMARLKWRFEIYPNGTDQDLKGFFIIHLRLLSLPSNIQSIVLWRLFIMKIGRSTWLIQMKPNEINIG